MVRNLTEKFLQHFRRGRPPAPRVLLVEDSGSLGRLLAQFLLERGYAVSSASTLEQAEAHLQTSTFDLVVENIMLPDGNGVDFVARIRELQPSIPVIIWTGLGCLESRFMNAVAHGVNGYVSKRLPLDSVLLEVKRLVRKSHSPTGLQTCGPAPTVMDRPAVHLA